MVGSIECFQLKHFGLVLERQCIYHYQHRWQRGMQNPLHPRSISHLVGLGLQEFGYRNFLVALLSVVSLRRSDCIRIERNLSNQNRLELFHRIRKEHQSMIQRMKQRCFRYLSALLKLVELVNLTLRFGYYCYFVVDCCFEQSVGCFGYYLSVLVKLVVENLSLLELVVMKMKQLQGSWLGY